MTPLELTAWAVLWLIFVAVLALVVVALRQIERAQGSAVSSPTALPVGESFPDIEVLEDGQQTRLGPFAQPSLVAFVSTTCGACETLMGHLYSADIPVPVVAVVTGTGFREYAERSQPRNLRLRWIVNPADARVYFNVSVVPTIYLVVDGKVAAVVHSGSPQAFQDVLAVAERASLDQERSARNESLTAIA